MATDFLIGAGACEKPCLHRTKRTPRAFPTCRTVDRREPGSSNAGSGIEQRSAKEEAPWTTANPLREDRATPLATARREPATPPAKLPNACRKVLRKPPRDS